MEPQKAGVVPGEKSMDRTSDETLRVLPSNISELRYSRIYRVKGVTRSIVLDALKVLDDMWEECQQSPGLMENYLLLRHYLDYLKRFCEGKA